MQEMLSYLIAHDTVHQQQWLAVIDDMGADAALPIPNNFDRSKEATEFSYMFMGTEHHAASIQPGRYCEGSSIDGRGEFSFRAGFEPLVEEPVPGPARPDSGAQVEQMKEPPVTHALTLMVPSASRPPPMGEVAIIACPPATSNRPSPPSGSSQPREILGTTWNLPREISFLWLQGSGIFRAPGMLHRLTLKGRSYEELRQLAAERRTLATSEEGHLRALLLNEAALLDFYAELRAWMERTPPSEGGAQFAAATLAPSGAFDLSPLLGTLGRRMGLSIADQQALLSIVHVRNVVKDEMIIEEGAGPVPLLLLCSGVARATRTLEDGGQQIVALCLPGDPLNPGDFILGRSGISISTFSPALVLSVSAAELLPILEQRPAIVRGLWRETAWRASVQREWLIWLGRKPAEARLAHLLCEIACRSVSSRRETDDVEFPLTQRELGDVLGLSTVHVNRVLQQLRNSKLVDFSRGRLVIRDRAGLYQAAEFDPAYLEIPAGEGNG